LRVERGNEFIEAIELGLAERFIRVENVERAAARLGAKPPLEERRNVLRVVADRLSDCVPERLLIRRDAQPVMENLMRAATGSNVGGAAGVWPPAGRPAFVS
jgi:hypothetical protein